MHYAGRLVISDGEREEIVILADVEAGVLAPIVHRQLALSHSHHLLLGWSSRGGGMQTIQALLVGSEGERLLVSDWLKLTTGRASSGVFVARTDAGCRLGIPEPPERVHNADSWELSAGGKKLDLKGIRALQFSRARPAADRARFYRPPFESALPPVARIAWVAMQDGLFQLPLAGKPRTAVSLHSGRLTSRPTRAERPHHAFGPCGILPTIPSARSTGLTVR
jgi:hypothetical protein